MELEQRVTELERRLAELEGLALRPEQSERPDLPEQPEQSEPEQSGRRTDGGMEARERTGGAEGAQPRAYPDEFWALQRLKVELEALGSHDGGVLFTGSVRLPTHETYEYQYGLVTDHLLDAEWADSVDVFAALGHGVRLRLLHEVLEGSRTAAELSELDGMGTSGQIYHHLRQLIGAGWLQARGRGRYEVPAARVVPLLVMLSAARR